MTLSSRILPAISLCAGQGLDLIGALARHPRHDDVTARLVEIDPRIAAAAWDGSEAAGSSVVPACSGSPAGRRR